MMAKRHKPATEAVALTVNEFCASIGLSRGMYQKLKRAGRGPKEMRIGRAIRISTASANAWMRERESKTT